jgi:hypothetical protein
MANSGDGDGSEWHSVSNVGLADGLERLVALDSQDLLAHMTEERKSLADRLAQIPLV